MSKKELDVKIGAAWQLHYDGKYESAVEQFAKLVAENPDNIDANWGLGLSYRKVGKKENALQVFEKARGLVTAALESNDDYERYFMLQRMVNQQIEQVNDFI